MGIQMIGRKHEEEKIWAIGKIVYTILESKSKATKDNI